MLEINHQQLLLDGLKTVNNWEVKLVGTDGSITIDALPLILFSPLLKDILIEHQERPYPTVILLPDIPLIQLELLVDVLTKGNFCASNDDIYSLMLLLKFLGTELTLSVSSITEINEETTINDTTESASLLISEVTSLKRQQKLSFNEWPIKRKKPSNEETEDEIIVEKHINNSTRSEDLREENSIVISDSPVPGSNKDLKNIERGACTISGCECDEYFYIRDVSQIGSLAAGWCLNCGHSPAHHKKIGSSSDAEEEIQILTPAKPNKQPQKYPKWKSKFDALDFPDEFTPLLEGTIDREQFEAVSKNLRTFLLSFLDTYHRSEGISSTSDVRVEYDWLATLLLERYPNMTWDANKLNSNKQSRRKQNLVPLPEPTNNSLARKSSREGNRKSSAATTGGKSKGRSSSVNKSVKSSINDDEAEVAQMTEEQAYEELLTFEDIFKNVEVTFTTEALYSSPRFKLLIQKTFKKRKEEKSSSLPFYLTNEITLTWESALWLGKSVKECEQILKYVILRLKREYPRIVSVSTLEEALKVESSKHPLLTMGSSTPEDQVTIGPKVFYTSEEKCIKFNDITITLEKHCTVEKSVILCFCLYYILNIRYPSEYAQLLIFLQNILMPLEQYTGFKTMKLKMLIDFYDKKIKPKLDFHSQS